MAHAPHPLPFRKRPAAIAVAAPPARAPWRALPWLFAALLGLAAATGLRAQVAINSTGAAPNTGGGHSILDISSLTKGLLIPRMTEQQRVNLSTAGPNSAAALDGLLVYQTDSVGIAGRGFYYYDFSTPVVGWKHIGWGGETWKLGGNAGTTAANFLGTLNNQPLVFRINNFERGRLSASGELQLYYNTPAPAPNELVEVQGAIRLTGGNAAATGPLSEGTIRYTPAAGGAPAKFEGYVVNTPTTDAAINGWKQFNNNFGERKIQESPIAGVSCQSPSIINSPDAAPRPWPVPGPTGGPYSSLSGVQSPYWGLWEDSHRQWLFRQADLSITGMCPGSEVRAIAFQVTSASGGGMRLHFLRFGLKNTAATTLPNFDGSMVNNDSYAFSQASPPNLPGPPPSYTADHSTGYQPYVGWNVHPHNLNAAFYWAGSNLIVDAAVDNQDWGGIWQGTVAGYNSGYQSMVSVFCDACGGPGGAGNHFNCKWNTGVTPPFYAPPTTPRNGVPTSVTPNLTSEGWGWTGGWDLTGTTIPELCDGGTEYWNPTGSYSQSNLLPRVAFLIDYTGGGAAFNVGNYMVAQEGLMIGDAGWAAMGTYPALNFHGPGTITAQRSVWSGNSLLSDYVFDLYYDGQAKPEDAQGASRYVRTPLKELPNYVERERHLPTVDGREVWNKNGTFSIDKLGNQLWVTVEDQSLYIQELNARMDALQKFLVEKKLKELEKR